MLVCGGVIKDIAPGVWAGCGGGIFPQVREIFPDLEMNQSYSSLR